MKYLFVGDPATGRPILDAMRATGTIVAAATEGERHRATVVRETETLVAATAINTPAVLRRIEALSVDVVVNFNSTVIFGERLLSCPRLAAINFHPGLLPRYAGLNVPQWAILNGETETGVTLHEMVPAVDAGAILAESRVPIAPTDTGLTLYTKLLRDGGRLMAELLERIARDGALGASRQQTGQRHVYRRRDRPDGRLAFSRPVHELVDLVRALSYRPFVSPLGVPRLAAPAGEIEVAAAEPRPATGRPAGTVLALETGALDIACRDGTLRIGRAYVDGAAIPVEEAARSVGVRIGDMI